jgi:hypothetical protein
MANAEKKCKKVISPQELRLEKRLSSWGLILRVVTRVGDIDEKIFKSILSSLITFLGTEIIFSENIPLQNFCFV